MNRSSSRMLGLALASAIMATGTVAMAQMSGTGATTGNPNTNAQISDRQNTNSQLNHQMSPQAQPMVVQPGYVTTPSTGGTLPSPSATGYGRNMDSSNTNESRSGVATGNAAVGGTGTGSGQGINPDSPDYMKPGSTAGSGSGGK